MKFCNILLTSIISSCLLFSGCSSDSDEAPLISNSTNSTSPGSGSSLALPTSLIPVNSTNGTNLTGLWLKAASYIGIEHDVSEPGDLESGDFTENGTSYTLFQIIDNGDNTLTYQSCAGSPGSRQQTTITFDSNGFVLPAGTQSLNGDNLQADNNVLITNNRKLTFTDFTINMGDPDGDSEIDNYSSVVAIKVRDNVTDPVGNFTIGSQAPIPVFCIGVSSYTGNVLNATDEFGNILGDFNISSNELGVTNTNGDELEIVDFLKNGSQDGGEAEYTLASGANESNDQGATNFTVTISDDFLTLTANGVVGNASTPVSINVSLN
ncbi:MAG: hypothetical protein QM504_04700 [Pseudomonadota bacterium]